jgi:branched-chain amino acid transport system ATP-binding protein
MMSEKTLLQTRDLSIQFGGIRAVDGVEFSVHAGEVVGLIGPNGAGKTTLLNLITGVYKPTSGTVIFDGRRIDGRVPHLIARSGIARTFQNIRLFRSLTVMEHVQLALGSATGHLKSVFQLKPTDHARDATVMGSVEDTLTRFGLWDQRTQVASELSYGLQRKLEIVRALMLQPQLLLLDEPTAGMNEDETMEVADLIRLLSDLGLGVLLIEHNMPFVGKTCDRVAVINFGKQITTGSPEEVRRDPRVLEAYLGDDHDYS